MEGVYAPGSLSTSYASLTAAIFASLPPLSGCAVRTALRLVDDGFEGLSRQIMRRIDLLCLLDRLRVRVPRDAENLVIVLLL